MKYEILNDQKIEYGGKMLYRIRRLSDGLVGGYVESENNLSQEGTSWIGYYAKVFGDAKISGTARVYDAAQIYGNAKVVDNARIFGNVRIFGDTKVFGNAQIYSARLIG